MHEGSCSYCLISAFEGEVFYVKYHSSNINCCFLYLLLTKGNITTVRKLRFSCQARQTSFYFIVFFNQVSAFCIFLNVYCR